MDRGFNLQVFQGLFRKTIGRNVIFFCRALIRDPTVENASGCDPADRWRAPTAAPWMPPRSSSKQKNLAIPSLCGRKEYTKGWRRTSQTHHDAFLEPGGGEGGWVLSVAKDNSGEIQNSRYTKLGLGVDGSDAMGKELYRARFCAWTRKSRRIRDRLPSGCLAR